MTVAELIIKLQSVPQHLLVAYYKYSEQCLLEECDIDIVEACLPRPDGWIQDKRPDKPYVKYLMLPGN